jgi:hypothetical protein
VIKSKISDDKALENKRGAANYNKNNIFAPRLKKEITTTNKINNDICYKTKES